MQAAVDKAGLGDRICGHLGKEVKPKRQPPILSLSLWPVKRAFLFVLLDRRRAITMVIN